MMSDTQRTVLTFCLIALLTLCIPFYLNFLGVGPEQSPSNEGVSVPSLPVEQNGQVELFEQKITDSLGPQVINQSNYSADIVAFVVQTNKYRAEISNIAGGSLVSFTITDSGEKAYQYIGGYTHDNEYDDVVSVNLLREASSFCSPCLNLGENNLSDFNVPFVIESPRVTSNQIFNISEGDSLILVMSSEQNGSTVVKETILYGDSYVIQHNFKTQNVTNINVGWNAGIRPTEKNLSEELTFSTAYIAQNKDIGDITFAPQSLSDQAERLVLSGVTDWVAIRNKYFITSLISSDAVGGFVDGVPLSFDGNAFVPRYSMGLNFSNNLFSVKQFFGPLDVDLISETDSYLDRVMNFGWLPIQPFSRSVLWILKTLYKTGLNYGLILILFAFLIRIITGPLTKKSFESSQKMQEIQPKLKNLQEKYKNDSQRLNKKMAEFYKKEGYNPLGGCLPMLVQMPLLFSLFIVFRSTIEFRGAPFFGWIDNLSQPDVLFNLNFSIPLYGSHVSFLPIILGVSMFMSQRLSMATMDPKQKPMMYIMSAFFFLIFNSFPSGLNIYYAVYNILNYFQQKGLKKA